MKQWHDFGSDPNTRDLRSQRRNLVRRARRPGFITDRAGYLSSLAKGRKVLDCGIVEHTLAATTSPGWLHRKIRDSATQCLGVDILAPEIDALRGQGFNVRALDVTREALPETFDLIIACDLIEHLENPGLAFANWAAMLKPNGRLIVTVPNPWYVNCLLKNTFANSELCESVDHVAWHEPATLFELGNRHGLKLDCYTGVLVTQTYSAKAGILFSASRFIIPLGFRYELFCKSMLYEFTLPGAPATDILPSPENAALN